MTLGHVTSISQLNAAEYARTDEENFWDWGIVKSSSCFTTGDCLFGLTVSRRVRAVEKRELGKDCLLIQHQLKKTERKEQ